MVNIRKMNDQIERERERERERDLFHRKIQAYVPICLFSVVYVSSFSRPIYVCLSVFLLFLSFSSFFTSYDSCSLQLMMKSQRFMTHPPRADKYQLVNSMHTLISLKKKTSARSGISLVRS